MEKRSNILLDLEKNCSSTDKSSLLVVCNNNKNESNFVKPEPSVADAQKKPVIAPLPPSQFLTKMKAFLGEMAEANERLKDNSSNDCDIEVLSGNESQLIEMDLILGVADLNTPEAVAAAESAISANQPSVHIATCDSESESESNSDDEDDVMEDVGSENDDENSKTCFPAQIEQPMSMEEKSGKKAGCERSAKQPTIVEI